MQLGVFISRAFGQPGSRIDEVRRFAREAEAAGIGSGWCPYLPWTLDPLASIQAAGEVTRRIRLGTAVVPTFLFPPLALARLAASVNAATGGRLVLGIGPSHPVVIQSLYGIPYARPARHTREYVEILRAADAREQPGQLSHRGEIFQLEALHGAPGHEPFPILLGAIGPRMLELAGGLADGTITTWADPRALGEYVVPAIRRAAAAAGRPEPRIAAVVPVCVTDDPATAREVAAREWAYVHTIPAYGRILDRGDSKGNAAGMCVIGNETEVRRQISRYADAGVGEFLAGPLVFGPEAELQRQRCFALLGEIQREQGGVETGWSW